MQFLRGVVLYFCLLASVNVYGSSADFRIIGGTDAAAGEIPFIVSLQSNGNHYCGGSLINKNWVLTAAHCVRYAVPDSIVANTTDLTDKANLVKFQVEASFVHPEYGIIKSFENDFALIKIKETANITPVKLNSILPEKFAGKFFKTAGWGNTQSMGYKPTNNLLVVDVPLVDQKTCETQLQNYRPKSTPYLDDSMFCAGYVEGGKDSCQGDSGGPIFYQTKAGKQYLVGVVSWGFGCADKDLSGIYGNVVKARNWINEVIAKNTTASSLLANRN